MRFSRTRSARMMSSPTVLKMTLTNPACARVFFSSFGLGVVSSSWGGAGHPCRGEAAESGADGLEILAKRERAVKGLPRVARRGA